MFTLVARILNFEQATEKTTLVCHKNVLLHELKKRAALKTSFNHVV